MSVEDRKRLGIEVRWNSQPVRKEIVPVTVTVANGLEWTV